MSTGHNIDVLQNSIHPMIHFGHKVDIAYDCDLEDLSVLVGYDGEHKTVIKIKELLVKKKYFVKNSKIDAALGVGNNLRLWK